jgi:hypothetical protein
MRPNGLLSETKYPIIFIFIGSTSFGAIKGRFFEFIHGKGMVNNETGPSSSGKLLIWKLLDLQ